jgi:predicted nucleic acid-binding protein
MTVLLDNTVLSNFAIVGRPELVGVAFVEQVGTTEQVLQEMQDGVKSARSRCVIGTGLLALP